MYLVDFVKVLVFVSLPFLLVLDVHHITQSSYLLLVVFVCSEPDDMKNVLGIPHSASQSKDVMTEIDKRH